MEGKLKISFIGDSHIAYWPFESYFPKWECYNYGVPGKGLDYVEMFHKDVSDSYVVVQLGTNDIYNLNTENMDVYVERYVKAVGAISSRGTYLFCIFPRNDFMDGTAVNCFIALLNGKIREKIKEETNVVYLDVFDKLLLNDKLNPDLTTTAHFAIQLSYPMSYLQHSLQARAGGLFVLVESVGVDVQRGGGQHRSSAAAW